MTRTTAMVLIAAIALMIVGACVASDSEARPCDRKCRALAAPAPRELGWYWTAAR